MDDPTPATATAIEPLPLPTGSRVPPLLIVAGGTFDPPHLAHVQLPSLARNALEIQHGCVGGAWLVYVPTARSPLKQHGPVASFADRAAMLTLALRGTDRALIWSDELRRHEGPSYTVDTLRRLRRWLDQDGGAAAKLRLLIGADQAVQFHRWKDPRAIIGLAEPAVMPRTLSPGAAGATAPAELLAMLRASGAWSDPELAAWATRLLPTPVIDATATSVRDAFAGSASTASAHPSILDPAVQGYIEQHGLYKAHP